MNLFEPLPNVCIFFLVLETAFILKLFHCTGTRPWCSRREKKPSGRYPTTGAKEQTAPSAQRIQSIQVGINVQKVHTYMQYADNNYIFRLHFKPNS